MRVAEAGRMRQVIGLLAIVAVLISAQVAASAPAAAETLQINVLSNRADLVSGGDALVEVVLPDRADPDRVRVDVDGRDVSDVFAVRDDGRFYGRVEGLDVGDNVLSASAPGAGGGRLTITNHPIGGPVISGPQLQPWACTTEENGLGPATDDQCNAPTTHEFYYVPVGHNTGPELDASYPLAYKGQQATQLATGKVDLSREFVFEPYDPQSPPPAELVATTTTDDGETVPYIVRIERLTLNRGIQEFAVLIDPSSPWEPWAPQGGWNGKLMWVFGGDCGTHYGQERVQQSDTLNDAALSRGFMVATSSMTELGRHCNTTWEAETVLMAKERIVESYGEIRYTIGLGCSGGSMGQHGIANQYPGLLDGLLPECSFPDIWSITAVDSFDCQLLNDYFDTINPNLWPNPAARDAVYGYQEGNSYCRNPAGSFRPELWDPDDTDDDVLGLSCGVPQDQLYNAETNPDGVRCTLQDYHVNILGRRPTEVWGPQEQQIGRGFANRFLDNVGLQYGLQPLATGAITPEQFVDLNEKVRCWDIDANLVEGRCHADLDGVQRLYRSGQIVYGTQLAKVAIIDARTGANNDVHSNLHAETTHHRLMRANGHTLNRVSWYEPEEAAIGGPTPATGLQAFLTLDNWLANVEEDRSDAPLEVKIVRNKPAEAADGCVSGSTRLPADACAKSRLHYGDPKTVAGMPLTRDVLKCHHKPLERSDYNVAFTDEQWARLHDAFPTGVCDWSRPGVGHGTNVPWLTYEDGPGGKTLGPPPRSLPFGKHR